MPGAALRRGRPRVHPADRALGAGIGGNRTDWPEYDSTDLDSLLDTIRAAPVPILGIYAGHQLIGRAHGAGWGSFGALHPGETDPDPGFAPG